MYLSGNTFTKNSRQAIEVLRSSIFHDVVWRNEGVPYVVNGPVNVYQPTVNGPVVTLTIEPGTTVKFDNNCRVHIGYGSRMGALFAQGTNELPIIFTSSKNFPKPGDWPGLYFYGGTADSMSVIENCIVEYGTKNMEFHDAKPAVRGNIIRYGSHSGLYYYGNGCDGADVSCNTFMENKVGVYADNNAGPVIQRNNFIKNSGHGVFNNTSGEVKATENWWNDVAGPNSAGDLVHGNVLVDPWLTEKSDCTEVPPTNTPPYAPQFPAPADNAVRVSVVEDGNPVAVVLSWKGGDPNPSDSVVYDVATGMAADALQVIASDLTNPSFDLPGLLEGTTYYWQVTARDTGGLETKGPVWTFTSKGDRPDLVVSEIAVVPEGVIAPDQEVTFTVTVLNDGAGPVVDKFRVSFAMDGAVVLNQDLNTIIPSGESTTISYTWKAVAGDHTLTVTADALSQVDESFEDNNGKDLVLDKILDTIAPELIGTYPVEGASVGKADVVTVRLKDKHGLVDDASVIESFEVKDANDELVEGSVTEAGDLFTFIPQVLPLPDGIYSVAVTAFDDSGNTKTYAFSFVIDAVPPEGLSITGGSTVSGVLAVRPKENRSKHSTIALTGTREEKTSVWINGTQRVGIGSGDWSVSVGMAQGENALEVYLKDEAGNASTALWLDVLVDSVAPSVVSVTPNKDAWLTTVPASVTVRYREETSGLNLVASTLKITNQSNAEIAGNWEHSSDTGLLFTPSFPFGEDTYMVHVALEDTFGNRSALMLNRFSVDFTPPASPVVNPVTSPTHTTTQTIIGTKEPYASVLLEGTEIIGHTEGTSWQHTATLANGDNSFAFSSKDRAGNVSETTTVLIRFDDVAPPALASGILKADGKGIGTVVLLDWRGYNESLHGDVASYRIYLSEAGQFSNVTGMTPVDTVSAGRFLHSVSGLTKGVTYHFAVVPVDRMGNVDPQVHAVAAVPQDTIPPRDVSVLSVTSNASSLLFTWAKPGGNESDITGYRVCFGDDSTGEILAGDQLSYEKSGLSKASKHLFKIYTRDEDGNESTGKAITGYTWLVNPTGLTVTPHSGYADLSWSASSPASHLKNYFVYVKEGGAFSDTAGLTPARTTSATSTRVAGLTDNQTYHFAVTAVNLSGGEDTSVASVEATPVPDLQGPELTDMMFSGAPLTGGLVLTASGIFTLAAADAAGVSRIEFYLDDTLVATDVNGSNGYSFAFDILSVEDGAHTLLIKAYDTLGNRSEFSVSVTVQLALPGAPVITSPADGFVTNQVALTVTGRAEKSSILSFTVNDVDSSIKTHADAQGGFRIELPLAEGENRIVATAENRAGKGPASSPVNVTLDTTIPQVPEGLQAQTRPSGVVKLGWKATQGASGYNIYRAEASFADQSGAHKLNSTPVTAIEYTDMPEQDGQWFYRITAVDAVTNESGLSAEVSAYSDETPPSAVSVTWSPMGPSDPVTGAMAPGRVDLTVTVNEALQAAPFFSVTPEGGFPIPVELKKETSLTYSGSFEIIDSTPSAATHAVFSARDMAGNRGTGIQSGRTVLIDTDGPEVTRLVITPDNPVKNDETEPVSVTVSIALDEKAKEGVLPELSYLLSADGRTEEGITNLREVASPQGTAQAWQGHFTLPADGGLDAPESLRFVFHAVDELGNESTKIAAPNHFQVYQGDLPPFAAPFGLTATALSGGKIGLDWKEVEGAVSYQLYRQAPGDAELTPLGDRVVDALYHMDQTEEDGTYRYAVASVRFDNGEESESPLSAAVEVTADSVAPDRPSGLELVLIPQGIMATWAEPSGSGDVHYRLYRSSGDELVSVEGLSPVVDRIKGAGALDSSPSYSQHCYAVTAVDEIGNESLPSESVYLNFKLLPVGDLRVVQEDDSLPVIAWAYPDTGAIDGYDIYQGEGDARLKLNDTLLASPTWTDTGYTHDHRVYTVAAVDGAGEKSPERALVLPRLTATLLHEDAMVKRGVMNRLAYRVENLSATPLDRLTLVTTLAGKQHRSELFAVGAEGSVTVPVIVGGYPDLEDEEDTTVTLEVRQNGNDLASIRRSSRISVGTGMLLLQVMNEEFIRGGDGQVRFSLENTGGEDIEIVTAAINGNADAPDIRFLLLDEEENVVTVARFRMALGSSVTTLSSGLTVAKIAPGAVFESDPVTMAVPAAAPEDLTLRAEIGKIFYRCGKPEEVQMPGPSSTRAVSLSDTTYVGDVTSVTPKHSFGEEEIVITGQAVNRKTKEPMPDASLDLVITLNGFERKKEVFTREDGTFCYRFTPPAGESGIYSVCAVHPDLNDHPVQETFAVGKVWVGPNKITVNIPKNYEQKIRVNADVSEGTALANLKLVCRADDQPSGELPNGVHLDLKAPISIGEGGGTARLDFILWADNFASSAEGIVLKAVSDDREEPWATIRVNASFSEAKPALWFTPNHVATGLAREDSVTETVTIENRGLADMEGVSLALVTRDGNKAPDWVTLGSPTDQGTLKVGEKRKISVTFAPHETVPVDSWGFLLRVSSSNHPVTDINLYASVTESGIGKALFKVSDIYTGTLGSDNLPVQGLRGARIRIQNEKVLDVDFSGTTDAYGELLFENLPTGRYKYRITASDHQETIGRLWIKPDMTATEDAFLQYNLVTVEWEVTETTIEDKYEVVLNVTYKTDVPAAVVVAEPASISLPQMAAGDVFQGEIVFTNYGLITAQNVAFTPPNDDGYFRYEFLVDFPETIGAKERVVVPYRVTCISSPDESDAQSTGGGCGTYSNCVRVRAESPCPNDYVSTTSAQSCFSYAIRCAGGGGGGGSGHSGGGGAYYGGSGHGSGGSYSRPTSSGIKGSAGGCSEVPSLLVRAKALYDNAWKAAKDTLKQIKHVVGCYANTLSREYQDDYVDMAVKVPGGVIEIRRDYYGDSWHHRLTDRLVFRTEKTDIYDVQKTIRNINDSAGMTPHEILRYGIAYTKTGDAYVCSTNTLRREDGDGWRWSNGRGNWERYDSLGRMLSFGNRNGVVGKLLYESGPGGAVTGVTDRNDRQVLRIEAEVVDVLGAGVNKVSKITDLADREVGYEYQAIDCSLQGSGSVSAQDKVVNDHCYKMGLHRVTDVLEGVTVFDYGVKTLTIPSSQFAMGASSSQGSGDWNYIFVKSVIEKVTDAKDRATLVITGDDGLSAITDADGNGHAFSYDYDDVKKEYHAEITTTLGMVKEIAYNDKGETVRVAVNGRTVMDIDVQGRRHVVRDEKGNVTTKEYDEWDNLTDIELPDGTSASFEYEHTYQNMTRSVDPGGVVTLYRYDDNGNLIEKTRGADTDLEQVTTYAYNADNLLESVSLKVPEGEEPVASRFTYDDNGNLATMTDPEENTTRFTGYDAMGNPLTMVDPRGYEWTFDYDDMGRLVSQTNPLLQTTSFEYDGANNMSAVVNALLKRFEFRYDDHNNMIKAVDPAEKYATTEYNTDSLPTRMTDQDGKFVTSEYDNEGRLLVTTDGAGNTTRYHYDESPDSWVLSSMPVRIEYPTFTRKLEYDRLQRVVKEIDLDGDTVLRSRKVTYDVSGNVASSMDENQETTHYIYDLFNRLVETTDPMGGVVKRVYDFRGNLVELHDPNKGITYYAYDRNNRLIKLTRPMLQDTSYEYDAMGNRTAVNDTKGQRIEYEYNKVNRIEKVTYFATGDHENPVKTVAFTYDAMGSLKTWDDGSASGSYTYDDFQRKTSETVNYGSFSLSYAYTYYANGQKKSFTGPDGNTVTYAWDDGNRLSTISIPGQGQITNNAFAWNAPEVTTLPGGSTMHHSYDALMRIQSMGAKDPAGKDLMTRGYAYSSTGNMTEKTTEHGTYTYAYDALNRLTAAANPTLPDEAYTYDAMGNRLTSAATSGTWDYNDNNEITKAGAITFAHDANGNMTLKAKGDASLHFAYDIEDRLVRVTDADTKVVATYGYDPFGRRLWKDVGGKQTFFLYADEGLIGEYDSTGNELRSYGWSPDSLWGTSPLWQKTENYFYWYQNDSMGTPQKLIRTSGKTVWSGTFDAFGNVMIDEEIISSNLRFAGQYFDAETGLYYNLNRYYDPETGRYLRVDPMGDGLNLYAYCYNNPNGGIDPWGLCSRKPPGFWESMVPVWGSARAAISDFQNGRYIWGTINTVLAISDVFLIKSIVTGVGKGAFKVGSHTWTATSKWLSKSGWRQYKGQHMHHWLFHRNQGLGKYVPDVIKNQPWNLMAMPNAIFHMSIHGKGKAPFNAAEKIWHGTPRWFKAMLFSGSVRVANTLRK
ncbi:RHS repeat-associated core domain-containing protein [Desulfoluna spongiiphila]|uniref:RHS repeat-associated core domain-containing protein n=2 Tax=Desulfoluna spongiiphila TaxID=419481 RepID=A0A1G5F9M1_9BACT|nr:RHS repeat-associated core domain-containing protein [Desulfoluna spongiiphila]